MISLRLLPGPSNQAAGRFLILSYFYGFLIFRSDLVAGISSVARRQVADSGMAYGFVYICVCMYMYCTCVWVCKHMYRLAKNNQ